MSATRNAKLGDKHLRDKLAEDEGRRKKTAELAAEYKEKKGRAERLAADLESLRVILLSRMETDERVPVAVGQDLVKEKQERVDTSDELAIMRVVDEACGKGEHRKCLETSLSVEKLRALEALDDRLKGKIPQKTVYSLHVREAKNGGSK